MEKSEPKVVRIVNLDKNTTNQELKILLKEQLYLLGKIEKTYIRHDNKLGLCFAYVIFEFSCDAKKAKEELNGFQYKSLQLDVAVVAQNSGYKEYISPIQAVNRSKNYPYRNPFYSLDMNSLIKGNTLNSTYNNKYEAGTPPSQSVKSKIGTKYVYDTNKSALATSTFFKTLNNNIYNNKYEAGTPPSQSVKSKIGTKYVYDTNKSALATSTFFKTLNNNILKRSLIEDAKSSNENKNKPSQSNQKKYGKAKQTTPKSATKTENTIKSVTEKNSPTEEGKAKLRLNQQRDRDAAKKTTPKLVTKSENTIKIVLEKNASSSKGTVKPKSNQESGPTAKKTTVKLATKSEIKIKNFSKKIASPVEGIGRSKLNERVGNKTTHTLATKSKNTFKNVPKQNASTAGENIVSASNGKTDNGLKTHKAMGKSLSQSKELCNTNKNKYRDTRNFKIFNNRVDQIEQESFPTTTKG